MKKSYFRFTFRQGSYSGDKEKEELLFIVLTEKTPSSKRSEGGGSSIDFIIEEYRGNGARFL